MSNGLNENYLRTARKCKKRFHGSNKPLRKARLRTKSQRKAEQDKEYRKLVKRLLAERPICECWLAENGWFPLPTAGMEGYAKVYYKIVENSPVMTATPEQLIASGALPSQSCHHTKGRGKYYLAYETFMAVSNHWHRWIHRKPKLAEKKGWLDPKRNQRILK